MAINKVIYGNQILIDLTEDTITPSKMLLGRTAHAADGSQITGTMKWRYAIQETLLYLDYASVNGTYLNSVGSVSNNTLIL